MRYHLSSVRTTVIKRTMTGVERMVGMWRKRNPS
jgi:hypothetical protein